MDLMRIFSLKSRATFFLLVALLCVFSFGAWWSVSSLIASEVRSRLDSHADRIAMALSNRWENYANTLLHVRGHFGKERPTEERFRRYLENTGFDGQNITLSGIGFAELRGNAARVLFLEPEDWQNRRVLGTNLFSLSADPSFLREALAADGVSLRGLPAGSGASGGAGLLMLLPYFEETGQGSQREARGLFFASVRSDAFFNQLLGSPSLQREPVNFVLHSALPNLPLQPLYDRFDLSDRDYNESIVAERPITAFGQRFILRVYPLPHFFSFADNYLALIVGLGAGLLSCLMMVVMRVSQNQLDFEILAKESSMEAARQSRLQVENLRSLNRFDQSLAGELDVQALVARFVEAIEKLTPVDASLLFFSNSRLRQEATLPLVNAKGIESEALRLQNLPISWLERPFGQSLHMRSSAPGAEDVLNSILVHTQSFSDWILAAITTRESGRCGLVFLGRKNGGVFSEVDHELFESIVSQFAASVEIAQLFSRVEDASKAKNAFLANMSHEIRTPLSAIIGFSDMLSRDSITARQRSSIVENIRKNGEQLTCIIDDILDLSKVEAGKLRIEKRRVRLASLVHEIRSVMELRARDKGVEFSVENSGQLPSHIDTDEVRLKQILMNLIGNSIKFTEKGAVRLILRYVQSQAKENMLVFTIKDTGIGISDEAQAELFRPFSQGDASHTRRYGGSGLGLALSKRLAQELGGDISLVESIKGQGSTFELRIEVGDLSLSSWSARPFAPFLVRAEKEEQPKPALDGLKILVVEDSEDNQEIFKYFLESSGARTEIVGNGIQAVKAAGAGRYDMILMDIQIPGIDGKEATRRIRQQGFAKPIVALTAHAMVEEQESCMRAGCNGQITKPVSGEMLISQVAEYMGRG